MRPDMTDVTSRDPAPASPSQPGGASDEAARFLEEYDPRAYPAVAVAVDVVLLTIRQGRLAVLLVRRGEHPHRGRWALPGGFVREDEDLDAAARRELEEETGLDATSASKDMKGVHLEQLRAYGAPGRDPRLRVVSVAHLALVPDLPRPLAGTDAADARFWPVDDLDTPDGPELAFDHARIVSDGVEQARASLERTPLATSFVEGPFTVADLRRVYEAVWGTALHPANFRRKVLSVPDLLVPTGEERATGRGWAALYTVGSATELRPPLLRPLPSSAGAERSGG
jgi:8-oxo-dGTP diphosphatase